MEKIKFNFGDNVIWHDILVTITDIWVVDESIYPDEIGVYYFVKSPWFEGSVKQSSLKAA